MRITITVVALSIFSPPPRQRLVQQCPSSASLILSRNGVLQVKGEQAAEPKDKEQQAAEPQDKDQQDKGEQATEP